MRINTLSPIFANNHKAILDCYVTELKVHFLNHLVKWNCVPGDSFVWADHSSQLKSVIYIFIIGLEIMKLLSNMDTTLSVLLIILLLGLTLLFMNIIQSGNIHQNILLKGPYAQSKVPVLSTTRSNLMGYPTNRTTNGIGDPYHASSEIEKRLACIQRLTNNFLVDLDSVRYKILQNGQISRHLHAEIPEFLQRRSKLQANRVIYSYNASYFQILQKEKDVQTVMFKVSKTALESCLVKDYYPQSTITN